MIDVKGYLGEKGYLLRDDKELLRAWAEVKVILSSSQDEFSRAVGITSRTLRSKIQKDREYFNTCVEEFTQVAEDNSSLTEEQLTAFVDNMIKLGTNPKSAKDLVTFAEYFEITPKQIKRIMQVKGYSFRGWLKESDLDFLNKEKLFKDILSMDVLYSQTKETTGATERAIEMDLNNPLDQYRLMLMGALFMSLYNQHSYSDMLNHLSLLMKLEQIKQNRGLSVKEHEAKKMAGTYEPPKPMTEAEARKLLRDTGLEDEKYIEMFMNPKLYSMPKLPDRETIQKEKDKYMPVDELTQWLNEMANKQEEMY